MREPTNLEGAFDNPESIECNVGQAPQRQLCLPNEEAKRESIPFRCPHFRDSDLRSNRLFENQTNELASFRHRG